jgi:hypothetical protein
MYEFIKYHKLQFLVVGGWPKKIDGLKIGKYSILEEQILQEKPKTVQDGFVYGLYGEVYKGRKSQASQVSILRY